MSELRSKMPSHVEGPVVEFHDVGVRYTGDIQALEHISLNVNPGDFLGLIGPNGAGKSTLIGIILGLVKPTTGYVRLFGEPVSPKNLKRIGYVPQIAHVQDNRFPSTVYETVIMGRIPRAGLFPFFSKEDHMKTEEAMKHLEIEDLRDRKIGELSGGQSQRVFTAKAFVGEPDLLIFDEPTSGVDTKAKTEFYGALEHLNRDHGITTILSLHDIGVVTKLARTIVCINKTLFFEGPTADFNPSVVLPRVYNYPIGVIEHSDHP